MVLMLPKLRPVLISDVIARVCSKVGMTPVKPSLGEIFRGRQAGVGEPGAGTYVASNTSVAGT